MKPAVMNAHAEKARSEILAKLTYAIGKDPVVAKRHDWLHATILALRDRIIDRWMDSTRRAYKAGAKRVYYLSLEFLIGRLLRDALSNLELTEPFESALRSLDVDLSLVEELEPDAALGNGGLGRLAACFMESLASLDIPAYGYGIRYSHGLFRQMITDGWQTERPEDWLEGGNPWEFPRREAAYRVAFFGHVAGDALADVRQRHFWHHGESLLATAYDTPMVGWRGRRVNTLRLWSARPLDPIHLEAFNVGDYAGALADHNRAEIITRVLYPADSTPQGQELRLRQEYFFTSASLQDIIRRHLQSDKDLTTLPDKVAIQLNDTHPAIAVAELMRLLVDMHGVAWSEAWRITQAVTAYTNHTLLPEALESWPVNLMERMLPRHMQIIYAINEDLLKVARTRPGVTAEFISSISLIDENGGRRVRMGQLAFVGSHSINGVSALHTGLMKETVFKNLHALFPGRINNKTNGITPRRWLNGANHGLADLLKSVIGDGFLTDAALLGKAEPMAADKAFRQKFAAVKRANKAELSNLIAARMGIATDPDALFDVQIKRIHEYKRQLLNILETVALYEAMRDAPEKDWAPRVKIFAGKAAASYAQAKLIIKLINDVAAVINADHSLKGRLKVAFIPNYNVSLAEVIVPATDLSEQISTAGMEASGTGNMKFALNGALTIGTLDGANVEIREHVGAEHFFLFGLEAHEVEARRRAGVDGRAVLDATPALKRVCEALLSGHYSDGDTMRYRPIVDSLLNGDWFMVGSDFAAFAAAQENVSSLWTNPDEWTHSAIMNTVRMGWFSSDRTITEYARDIWSVPVR
ncbi:MAG: glycogen/starch/alpha-glucan phosphorylase [Rhizobiales bacterium]|nr:glycogen/starch/alpha-glucan phosphorylase [Hyphomicrobiales bacterium]